MRFEVSPDADPVQAVREFLTGPGRNGATLRDLMFALQGHRGGSRTQIKASLKILVEEGEAWETEEVTTYGTKSSRRKKWIPSAQLCDPRPLFGLLEPSGGEEPI